jgi:protein ImuB
VGLAHVVPPRVLVVWCPDWPVVVAGTDPAAPAVVVAADLVVACSPAARAAGIRRGQRLRDAQRYCPGLIVRARDLGAEGRAFESVVAAVAEFCPRVEVIRPGMCAIGARGPARYFGGEKALAEKIIQALAGRGVAGRTGVADGMFAARLAARTGSTGVMVPPGGTRRFLAPHPVHLLEDARLAGQLSRLGIHTLGDFAALPAGDVLSRFGVLGATAHRLASGLEPRPLAPRVPAADLSVTMEFDPPAEQAEPVVFAGKALAGRLHTNLAGRGLACVRIEVQVVFAGGQTCSRLWRHDGLLSSLAVAERVRWQLGGWRTACDGDEEAAAPGAVRTLRLIPDQISPDTGTQLGLWGEAPVSGRVARAASRVQSLLGHEAVTRPVRAGGRGPGEQVTLAPFGDSRFPRLPADRPWPGRIPAPSPVTVYPAPLPASVTCAAGKQVTVTGRAAISAPPQRLVIDGGPPRDITAWAGPWPVHEQWWDPVHVRRLARFQLVTKDGAAWLAAVEGGRWVIEASYD